MSYYQINLMARVPNTHPSASIAFTAHAAQVCAIVNTYRRQNPTITIAEMAKRYRRETGVWLSETSIGRYYYGVHQYNNGGSYTQVRRGACVSI